MGPEAKVLEDGSCDDSLCSELDSLGFVTVADLMGEQHVGFVDEVMELLERRREISSDLLGIESRMTKLEQNDLAKHAESGNAVLGFSRYRKARLGGGKLSPRFMVFSNSSTTTKSASMLAERAEKVRKAKLRRRQMETSWTSTSAESASDTDPETVGLAGLEAAASRDAELRAAYRKQYEAAHAVHQMKRRSQE